MDLEKQKSTPKKSRTQYRPTKANLLLLLNIRIAHGLHA